jgi:hypothetical protein
MACLSTSRDDDDTIGRDASQQCCDATSIVAKPLPRLALQAGRGL